MINFDTNRVVALIKCPGGLVSVEKISLPLMTSINEKSCSFRQEMRRLPRQPILLQKSKQSEQQKLNGVKKNPICSKYILSIYSKDYCFIHRWVKWFEFVSNISPRYLSFHTPHLLVWVYTKISVHNPGLRISIRTRVSKLKEHNAFF